MYRFTHAFTYGSFVLILTSCTSREPRFDPVYKAVFTTSSTSFKRTLENYGKHEIQIVYGEIIHRDGKDTIVHHHFEVDSSRYFYPASSVKMPVAFAAVQKLSQIGMSVDASLVQYPSQHHPRSIEYDSLYHSPLYMKNILSKIFVYSDNHAYNVLYNWLGQSYIRSTYEKVGIPTRIIHQLSEDAYSYTPVSNEYTSHTGVFEENDSIIFLPKKDKTTSSLGLYGEQKGQGFIGTDGELVSEPFDFSVKNYISLPHLLQMLEVVIKPELFEKEKRLNISDENLRDLKAIMHMKSTYMPYPIDTLPQNYVKFFMYGDNDKYQIPPTIKILNKVGWAYGYLTDVAYIRDAEYDIEFFLAATIHVNENEVYNDGVYEYQEVGLPFLAELGRLVYEYERKKKLSISEGEP